MPSRRLSVAPMMDYTDRHARYLLRLISRRTLLYTEMVTAAAVVHGDTARLLAFDAAEHPVALQLGGADPAEMAQAARIGAEFGYDEINLNIGCPSDRVQSGRFGACLMAEPDTVADCVRAMRAQTDVPVTVKTRIGIDHRDSYEELCAFVDKVAEAGCETFIVHARKAWLQGLSPKQNREIPPLDYPRVHRLKRDYPELEIIINGGIRSLDETERELAEVDGVMIGRAVFDDLWMLAEADRRLFGSAEPVADAPCGAAGVCRVLRSRAGPRDASAAPDPAFDGAGAGLARCAPLPPPYERGRARSRRRARAVGACLGRARSGYGRCRRYAVGKLWIRRCG